MKRIKRLSYMYLFFSGFFFFLIILFNWVWVWEHPIYIDIFIHIIHVLYLHGSIVFCLNLSLFRISTTIIHSFQNLWQISCYRQNSVSRFRKSYYDSFVPEAIFSNRYFPSKHRCRRNTGKRHYASFMFENEYALGFLH